MHKYKLFDHAIILALDKRKEHWQDLLEQCSRVGIEATAFICGDGSDKSLSYDQIDDINPDISNWGYGVPHLKKHHWNAFKAHQGMIRLAKERGYKSVLFLEDDALILNRWTDVMNRLEENLPNPINYLAFYLGWWHRDENDEWNLEIERRYKEESIVDYQYISENFGGLHAVVFRAELYDLLLSLQPNNPIDTQLCYLRQWIPSFYLRPKVITVKSIYSYTEGCTFGRKDLNA